MRYYYISWKALHIRDLEGVIIYPAFGPLDFCKASLFLEKHHSNGKPVLINYWVEVSYDQYHSFEIYCNIVKLRLESKVFKKGNRKFTLIRGEKI